MYTLDIDKQSVRDISIFGSGPLHPRGIGSLEKLSHAVAWDKVKKSELEDAFRYLENEIVLPGSMCDIFEDQIATQEHYVFAPVCGVKLRS